MIINFEEQIKKEYFFLQIVIYKFLEKYYFIGLLIRAKI